MEPIGLENIGLSSKVLDALVAAGLDTIDKAIAYQVDADFTALPGIGDAGAAEIKSRLATVAARVSPDDKFDNTEAAGKSDTAVGDDTAAGDDTAPLDPNEPGISPGERGRRQKAAQREQVHTERTKDIKNGGIPGDDPVTSRGKVIARKTAFVRGGQTFYPAADGGGGTVVAHLELRGECDERYFADAVNSEAAYLLDVSQIEVDAKGERVSAAEYVARLRHACNVGNNRRPAGHVIGRLVIPNYRIAPATVVGMMRQRAVVYRADPKFKK